MFYDYGIWIFSFKELFYVYIVFPFFSLWFRNSMENRERDECSNWENESFGGRFRFLPASVARNSPAFSVTECFVRFADESMTLSYAVAEVTLH